jgi:uncharacterized protein (TIGR03437 family)
VTQQAAPPPPLSLLAVANGANYTQGGISPGEIVVLGGTNMGPAQGVVYQVSADGKSIPKTLAGVQVLFGTAPAVLLYVSSGQINAIVPYSVAGSSKVDVVVQYQNAASAPVTVPVQQATPGIFSQDRSGQGPGAILNQDFSLNTSLVPATAGSVIQIFATGGGVVSPVVADGFLAPVAEPLPRLTLSVSVTIGGIPASIAYSGDAPGEVAGVMQINATIPPGVTPGQSVPVVVTVNGIPSQNGLTISVQ